MSGLVVEDLVSGLSEWRNIQEIVRMTFNALHDVVKAQGEKIKEMENALRSQSERSREIDGRMHDLLSSLRQKASISDVNRSIAEITKVLDAKADATEVAAQLERKVSTSEIRRGGFLDGNVVLELEKRMQEKANRVDVDDAIALAREDSRQAHRSLMDLKRIVDSKVDVDFVTSRFVTKGEYQSVLSISHQLDEVKTLQKALDQRASKSELNAAISGVMQELSDANRSISELIRDVAEKPDLSAIMSQLEKKASKTDLQALFKANLDDVNALVEQHELALESIQTDLNRKANASDVAEALESKASLTALQEGLALKASKQSVENALHRKANRADVDTALERKADISEVNGILQRKADADQVSAQLTQRPTVQEVSHIVRDRMHDATARLEREVESLASKAEVEAKLREARNLATEGRAEVGALHTALDAKASTQDVRALLSDLGEVRAALEDVTASEQGLRSDLSAKANMTDVLAMLDSKVGVDEINRALTDVNRELELRVRVDDMRQLQEEVGAVLAHSNMYGRWIWKSGKTKGPAGGVPWNVQSVNTAPDNFIWERDKVNLVTVAPGLYELTFGFYSRKKPTVQMLVNGEPILSAMNSTSYAVHHSSGRLTSVERHPAGNVTGLTLIDFLALPPRARIALTYSGEEGAEGFLGLRKL